MSLTNAIKAFVNPPDDDELDADSQQSGTNSDSTNKPVTKTGGSQGDTSSSTTENSESSEPATTESDVDDELQEYSSANGADADPPTTPDEQDTSVQPKSQVEGEYWPYMFQPTDRTLISDYEINQTGHPITEHGVNEDETEVYMGDWPRSMIETRQHRDKPTTWIGYQDDPIKKVDAGGIAHEYLFRHSTIFGETGQGKTTLLMNMMLQWINAGYGTCFIDPKGAGDAKELIQRIPNRRLDDVIWIEPGSQREKMIGFNLLETDSEPGDEEWHSEVQELVEQFTEVIKNTENSDGAIINEVTEEVTRYLVRQDYNYNVLDLYTILFNEDDRKKLPELETDQFGKQALQSVADKEEDQLESIKRRVRPWVTDITTREILDVRDTGVNLTKAIEEGKILIVKTDNIPDEGVTQMFVTAMVRRLWSTIKRRNINEGDFDPYFLVVDEFDKVAVDRLGIGDILSEARAFKFSITLATQQPSSLDKDVQQGVFKNSKNIFTFSPGSHEDARTLSQELGDEIDPTALKNLGKYRIAGQILADGQPHPVILDAFPPYPPLHTKSKAEEIIQKSLDRYGKPQGSKSWDDDSEVFEEYGIVDEDEKEKNEDHLKISDDVSLPIDEFLRCVFLAQVKKPTRTFNGEEGYISTSDLQEVFDTRYNTRTSSNFHNAAQEKISDTILDRKMDGEVYVRLKEEGEAIAFKQDTGKGMNSGKAKHRRMLATSWKEFTRLGYNMELPTQEEWDGEDPPDGVATPPILPFEDADNPAEFEELQTTLQSEYPQLYKLFDSNIVSVEAESTTLQKPAQTVKNLAKAINRGQKCALVVNEKQNKNYKENPYEKKSPEEVLEMNASTVYNIFQNPPFVSKMDEDGNRKFYTKTNNLNLKGGGVALQKGESVTTVWREDGNKVILESDTDEDTVAFRDAKKILDEPLPSTFNYYYEEDKRSNLVVVKNSKQEVVEEYDTVEQMRNDGWSKVAPPAIPEVLFDGDEDGWMPTQDDWKIFVKPRESNPDFEGEKLYTYNPDPAPDENKFEPLIPEDIGENKPDDDSGSSIAPPSIGGSSSDDTENNKAETDENIEDDTTETTHDQDDESDDDDFKTDELDDLPTDSTDSTEEVDESIEPESEEDAVDDTEDEDQPDWVSSYQDGEDSVEDINPDDNKPTETTTETSTTMNDDTTEETQDTPQDTMKPTEKPSTTKPTADDDESESQDGSDDKDVSESSTKPTTDKPSSPKPTEQTQDDKPTTTKPSEDKPTTNKPTQDEDENESNTQSESTSDGESQEEEIESETTSETVEEETEETVEEDDEKIEDEDSDEDEDEWGDFTESSIDI